MEYSIKKIGKLNYKRVIFIVLMILLSLGLYGQQLAFPGAEGFGRFTTGGRGGTVYHVTNLNDSGAGSFRDAVSQSNRIVVFDVGGIIRIGERIVIKKNVTIAGQTAPGGGITIYGNGIALNGDSGNNIIRYIRVRMGKNGDTKKDAVAISDGSNYMFDHVSISWGIDGTLDVNATGTDLIIEYLSFQECIVSQGINIINHSTGGLMQPTGKWSVIRSLYIDNKTRNPKARFDHEFINSVLYNWASNGYIMGDTVNAVSECNLIGNYFIYGPSSSSGSHITNTTAQFHVYGEDNWVDSNKNGTLDGTLMTNYKTATVMNTPFNHPGVNNQLSARDALNHVIEHVGASIVRDAVDDFLIDELTSYGTKGKIINTEDDNGIPNNVGSVAGGTPPQDSDQDGMPDAWEQNIGLNPNSADHNGDHDGDGYTNIEEYLSELAGDQPPSNDETPQPTTTPIPAMTPTSDSTEEPIPTPASDLDCSIVPEWTADAVYVTAGMRVVYNNNLYETNWYSSDQNPEEYSGEYDVWTLLGSCDGVSTPAPTETPSPAPVDTPVSTPSPPVNTPDPGTIGDVNSDCTVGIVDALLIAQYYVGLNPANFNPVAADVNCDGLITIVDALLVAQYYVGLISKFC